MLAMLAPVVPSNDSQWAFEMKWDGIRLVTKIERGRVQLMTRNRIDATARYPELGALGAAVEGQSVVLDGEIVGFDESGRHTFEALQQRMGLEGGKRVAVRAGVAVAYMVFDLLALDGGSLLNAPYTERRAALEELGLDGPHWHTPPYSRGSGEAMLQTSRDQSMEGVVAKRLDSKYEPGKRTSAWLKVKNQQRQEFVIGGWVPGAGRRTGKIGALVIGYRDGNQFVSAGKVGTGFTDAMLRELEERLRPLTRATSPFTSGVVPRETQHSEPQLVCEVEFTEWTSASGQLRHPSFKGLRTDKSANEVVRETPA
jgi:bifunctional non-homologous end joining protein LigD